MEQEAIRIAEEERLRAIQEMKQGKEKDKRDIAEQALREDQLQTSIFLFNKVLQENYVLDVQAKEAEEWRQYLKCDGLPIPVNCPEMNTYLHLWKQEINVSMDDAVARTSEVIGLLDVLEDFIHDPLDVTDRMINNWIWVLNLWNRNHGYSCREFQVRGLFRDQLKHSLDYAIYTLLRDVENRLDRISIPKADFHCQSDLFALNLFVMVQLPTPAFNPRKAAP